MKTQHTPGPWVFAFGSVYQNDKTKEIDANRLLMADRDNDKTMPTERDANCLLAATAPELLSALEDLESALTHDGDCQCCPGSNEHGHDDLCPLLKARAAIAKATGKE